MRRPTRGPAKFSAAKAPPMSPARVMATWIVDKNFAGCSVRAESFPAFLFPSWTMCFNLVSFMEITAISAQEQNASMAIRTRIKIKTSKIRIRINKIKINRIKISKTKIRRINRIKTSRIRISNSRINRLSLKSRKKMPNAC